MTGHQSLGWWRARTCSSPAKESGSDTPPAGDCGPSGSAAISALCSASACMYPVPCAPVPHLRHSLRLLHRLLQCRVSGRGCNNVEAQQQHRLACLQHCRGDGAHDGVAADGRLGHGTHAGRDVDVQPARQHDEAGKVHREQLRQERLCRDATSPGQVRPLGLPALCAPRVCRLPGTRTHPTWEWVSVNDRLQDALPEPEPLVQREVMRWAGAPAGWGCA